MTDVTVVVSTRDRRALLTATLRSVLDQRDVDLAVVVVDDASRDGTADLLAGCPDRRVRVVRNEVARGPNAARNRGAEEATGDWLAFVDDDDLWAPDKLVRQLEAAAGSGRSWVYAGTVNVDDRLRVVHGVRPPSPEEAVPALSRYNAIPAGASNVVIRRLTFLDLGGFDERLRVCEEWDLWLRLAAEGPPAWVPSPLVAYRMHDGNTTLDVEAIVEGARAIEARHGVALDWGRLHGWMAQLCLRRGRRAEALGHYARAAARGRGRDVLVDFAALGRGRLRRGRATEVVPRRAEEAWEQEAQRWIDELSGRTVGESPGWP